MRLKFAKIVGILLLSLLLSSTVSPALAYSMILDASGLSIRDASTTSLVEPHNWQNIPYLASSQLGNIYGFRTLFYSGWSSITVLPSYGSIILTLRSGEVAILSNSSKYVYFAEQDKVHILNLTRFLSNGTASTVDVKINGSFYYGAVFPRPAAPGPNDTVILAPHGSNPYIVMPNGTVIRINVYDDTEKGVYTHWLAGNGTLFALSSSKGLSIFKVGRDLKPSLLERLPNPDLGGMVAVSNDGTVAVITSNRTLYLYSLNDNVDIHLKGYIGVTAPQGASYFYAVKPNGQIVKAWYSRPDVITKNITATSYKLNSLVSMAAVSTKTYDVVAVLYGSHGVGNVLDILVVDSSGSPVSMKGFKVDAINVALRNYNGTVYFAASGYQTIVGAVNGTRIGAYTIAKETEGTPYVGGFNIFLSTAIDVVPVLALAPYVEGLLKRGFSPQDILVVDMLGDWGAGRIRAYRPLSLFDTPHVELRGEIVVPTVVLNTGTPSQVPLGRGEMIPLGVTLTVNRAVKAAGSSNLVTGGPYLEWHDVSVRHAIVRFDELAYTKTVAMAQMNRNIFSVTFNYTGVWHSQLFATGSVAAPSLGIIYYDLAPNKLSDYDRFLLQGRITSTQGIPGGAFSAVYGYGLTYTVTAVLYMASALIMVRGESLKKLLEEREVARDVQRLVKIWDSVTKEIQQATEAGKAANVFQSAEKVKLLPPVPDDLPSVIPVVPNPPIFEFEVPPIEELCLGAAAIIPSGILRANLPSDLIDRAARVGITREQIGDALANAVKMAAQDAITASSSTVSVDSQLNTFVSTIATWLQEMQQNGFYINMSGTLYYVDPQTASTFINAFVTAIGYYAGGVSEIYNGYAKTNVSPSPSLNTLRDVYYWSKYIYKARGYSDEDASRMAATPVTYIFLAAANNATRALARALKSKGVALTDQDVAKIEWNFILNILGGTSMNSNKNALAEAFPPPPRLVAEYFEEYLNKMTGASTSSAKQQVIKELAREISGASVVVTNGYREQGITATTLVWEFEKVEFGVVGLGKPLEAVWLWFQRSGWVPLAVAGIIAFFEKYVLPWLAKIVGQRVITALTSLAAMGTIGAAFAIGYMGGSLIMAAILTDDKGRGGATTLDGIVFDVYDQGKRIGIFVMRSPPDITVFNVLVYQQSLRDFLKGLYESAPQSFGYDKLIMDFVQGDPSYINVKDYLLHFVSNYATIRRVGLAYMVLGWVQPTPLTFSDVVATLSGKIDVSNFEFLGVNLKTEGKVVNASLPEEFWRRVNVRVYRDGALLGDMPFDYAGGYLNGSYLYAVYRVPFLYSGATDIFIEIPKDMGQIYAEVTMKLEAAIIGELGTSHPYTAVVSYSSAKGAFNPVSFGIFNLDKIPGYPAKPLAAIQVEVVDSDPPPRERKAMITGDDVLSGMVGGSPYNYLFTDPYLMPISDAHRFKLQYWLYLNTSKPEQRDERNQTRQQTQPLDNNPKKVKTIPTANETVVPPWLNVSAGSVGLSLYLNGTHSYAMLPRMLTAYVYTPEPNVDVNLYTWWVIEYENNTAKRWMTAAYGSLYNITVTTPGGKYSAAVNVYIGNYSDYAAYLARKLNTIVALKFFGKAVRLDNYNYDKAMAPVSLIYPDMQGNLTSDLPVLTVYVYNALNYSVLPGATVRVVGASGTVSGTTDSNGNFTVQLPAGSYKVSVSKPGYYNYSLTIYLSRNYLLNVPLVPTSSSESYTGWLIVHVRSLDGLPLANATVYINGTVVGKTDSDGAWYGLFNWGTVQRVKVSYGSWTSEERSLNITHSRVLTTFTAMLNSDIFKPMVWAYAVYPVGVTSVYSNITLLAAVITNSNNTYTVEVGLKTNGTKVSYVRLTRTVKKPGADVFLVSVPSAGPGKYVAYLNITWAKADNSPDDNYVESEPFGLYSWYTLDLYVTVEVLKWGRDIPGLIYPGDTVYRVNITASLLDVAGARNYSQFLKTRAGKRINLPSPLKIDLVKQSGTTAFVDEIVDRFSLSEIALGTSIIKSVNITAPFARFMTATLRLPPLLNGTLYTDNETAISISVGNYTVKLPPHLIVKGIDYMDRRPVRLGDNITVSLRVWTNYLPGEGMGGLLMMAFGKAENKSFVAYSVAKVPDLYDGDQTVKGKIIIPRDYKYNFSWWEPYKVVDVKFTIGRVPDSYSGDNYVEDSIMVINTGSAITWFLILFAILILVLLLIAFINAIKRRSLSRLAMSEWLEHIPEKTIPSRSVHRSRENSLFNLEWLESVNKDKEK